MTKNYNDSFSDAFSLGSENNGVTPAEIAQIEAEIVALQAQMVTKAPINNPTFTGNISQAGSGAGAPQNIVGHIGSATTTGAAPVLIQAIPIPNNISWAISGKLIGRRTGGVGANGDSAVYYFEGGVRSDGGSIASISPGFTIRGSDSAIPEVNGLIIAPSPGYLQFIVEGATGVNIQWDIFIEIFGRQ